MLLFKLALLFIQMRITITTTITTTIATPIATPIATTIMRMLEICGMNGPHMVSTVGPFVPTSGSNVIH